MKNLLISETYINRTENYCMGEGEVYETRFTDIKELKASLAKEHGRCTGKIYIDVKGKTQHVGWLFRKRVKYDDVNETFTQEVWVSVHEKLPKTIKQEFLKQLGGAK